MERCTLAPLVGSSNFLKGLFGNLTTILTLMLRRYLEHVLDFVTTARRVDVFQHVILTSI